MENDMNNGNFISNLCGKECLIRYTNALGEVKAVHAAITADGEPLLYLWVKPYDRGTLIPCKPEHVSFLACAIKGCENIGKYFCKKCDDYFCSRHFNMERGICNECLRILVELEREVGAQE